MSDPVGLVGTAAILVAWLFHAHESYLSGRWQTVNPAVPGLYAVGSAIMAFYAVSIGDGPFTLLHTALAAFTATEMALLVWMRRSH